MKVLIIHNLYQSHLNGGEDAVFRRETKALTQALGSENVITYTVSNDDLKLSRLPFSIWHNRKHAKNVMALCKKHQIDLVHVHNFFPLLTTSVFLAAKKAGAKVVHTLHNYRWWCLNGTLFYQNHPCHDCLHRRMALPGMRRGCYRGSRLQSLLAGLAFAFYKRKKVMNAIDAFLVLSEHQRSIVSTCLPVKKVFLKPNAIDASTGSSNKKGFVFVGRLEEGKGIEVLLKAWPVDQAQELIIIGSGPLEEKLKKRYASSTVRFLGNQPFSVAMEALAHAQYCIHPSLYYETFGLVVIEAMSRGTPVIGFDVGTRPEFIKHGVNGLLTTPEQLSKTLTSLGAYDYQAMSQRAMQSAKQYQSENVLAHQLNTYQAILESA